MVGLSGFSQSSSSVSISFSNCWRSGPDANTQELADIRIGDLAP